MRFREFIRSKIFLRQLLYASAAAIVIMWVSLKLLDIYTHHGRTITVPELQGFFEQDARDIIKDRQLRYIINDSIFYDDGLRGSIFSQDPPAGTEVKKGRTIYLTKIAIMPEMVEMPDLNDLSLRQAIAILTAYGLRPGQLDYRPDIARNAVLQQKYNKGTIEPGTLIAKGTNIDLVLGKGLGENLVMVPVLLGFTKQEAIRALHAATLNVGNSFYLDDEEDNVKVYKQHPDPLTRKEFLQAGSSVDIYYRSPEAFDFETYLLEQLTVPIPLLFGKTPEEARLTIEVYDLELGEEVFEGDIGEDDARVFKQEPDYEEDSMIQKGSKINIWYRSLDAFNLDLFENQQE